MTLDAPTYFGHLKAYVNDRYVVDDGDSGEVVLREKYFPATGTRAKTRKIRLILPGPGLAFKLDRDQVELQRKKSKHLSFISLMTMRSRGQRGAISSSSTLTAVPSTPIALSSNPKA